VAELYSGALEEAQSSQHRSSPQWVRSNELERGCFSLDSDYQYSMAAPTELDELNTVLQAVQQGRKQGVLYSKDVTSECCVPNNIILRSPDDMC
jgi:hypothetical protein